MKAIMPEVPPHIAAWRKRVGADRWDEMWEGVLHMPPAPNLAHQDFQGSLENWLRNHWMRGGNRVLHDVNVASIGGWPGDYRIPDLVLLTPDRLAHWQGDCIEGPPNVVVEIRSPHDETMEKLSFYASLGVPEVWIIQRDTRDVEILALEQGDYRRVPPAAGGWLHSPVTGIWLRADVARKLAIQMAGDEKTLARLPED